jgi:RNA polymerase sigma factor FliA
VADAEVAELWTAYAASRDPALRNRLVLQYAPLVKYVAGRVRSGLPASVDQNDLISDGVVGLMEAVERFDPERGLPFQAYAVTRIRGAMLDALRQQAWVPRLVRDRIREVERAYDTLQDRLNRTPTEAEVAREMGTTVAALREIYAKMSYTSATAVEDLMIPDEAAPPGQALEDDAVRQMLVGHVRQLRERDQIIIAMYYYEGFTLAEIGAALGVTESRISQLHTRAMLALRAIVHSAAKTY